MPEAAPLAPAQHSAVNYAGKLTRHPDTMAEADAGTLRSAGFDDGQILEINQVVACFACANRMVLRSGCSTEGDIIGLSPGNSDDPQDWGHR